MIELEATGTKIVIFFCFLFNTYINTKGVTEAKPWLI